MESWGVDSWLALLAAGGVMLAVSYNLRQRHAQARMWRGAAQRLNLAPSIGLRNAIDGRIEGFDVRVAEGVGVSPHIAFSVRGGGIPEGVRITPRKGQMRARTGRVLTQDADFDGHFELGGDANLLCAALDHVTRRSLEALGCRCENGEVAYELEQSLDAPDRIAVTLNGLLAVAARLRIDAEEVPAALQQNVADDPAWGFRLRCLQLLEAEHADTHFARRARPLLRAQLLRALGATPPPELVPVVVAFGDAALLTQLLRSLEKAIEEAEDPRLKRRLEKERDGVIAQLRQHSGGELSVTPAEGGALGPSEEETGALGPSDEDAAT